VAQVTGGETDPEQPGDPDDPIFAPFPERPWEIAPADHAPVLPPTKAAGPHDGREPAGPQPWPGPMPSERPHDPPTGELPVPDGASVAAATGPVAEAKRPWWKAPPRHPAPRDWRWIVSGVGKLLITLGVLILLFVGYQLWGTGIQYRQAQAQLEKDFNRLATATASTTTTSPRTVSTSPGTTPTTAAVTLPPPPPVTTPVVQEGDPVGVIRIPTIDLESWIVSGVDPPDLRKGVGHYPSTPMPGEQGNAALAGHRTTYGHPFYDLDKLDPGDLITVQTLTGSFTYSVTGSTVVNPSDTHVIDDQPDKVMLTLTTCDPKYSARNRLIVTAELVPDKSDPIATAAPTTTTTAAPGQTATSAPAVTAPATLPGSDTGGTEPGAVAPGDTGSGSGGGGGTGGEDEAVAGFEQGWFSDHDAWPQVALWGLGCTAIALLAWFISHRTRNVIGAVLAIAPFVVVLYFFFENVDRLLPPNL
jgi:sortase A